MSWSFIPEYLPYFNDGVIFTIIISVFVVIFGTVIGILAALGKMSKIAPLRWILNAYIEIFRDTPMLVQIALGYAILGVSNWPTIHIGILSEDSNRLAVGILILSLNSGAYMAEIVRAGIEAVPAGQKEAAYSLGIRPAKAMMSVILPQAVRNILPAVGNEFVTIIKDSSLLSTIGVMEIYFGTQTVITSTYQTITPLLLVSVYYFVVCFALSRLLARFEKKLGKGYAK
ncbi:MULTISPECIES: amino acid ABC transporter permease [unclassified Lactococcus]|uniref:amino acid ABC transporter permease n=1 Tax=unclassified Lactococcus TaxID=2643510 RepID=UPI0011CB7E09|nr:MULTISPECIES: amino acid ABC transporter permease [unclassified Lactococcus]MQW22115.1 ABC transporter permease subunit [Lactococcus sp. dk101]TXK45054.1 amino acid ABC transporter permease [Lactococcus sp. dk310]TXK51166.1 amino acid ABC transporter permease [Lactococcus sp. dk322]